MLSSDNGVVEQTQEAPGQPPAPQSEEPTLARNTPTNNRQTVKRGVITPEGREALTEAQVAADLVRDHREQATRCAVQRARAVMRASQHGVSYRQIADALSVSIGMVQQWMRAALRLDEDQS